MSKTSGRPAAPGQDGSKKTSSKEEAFQEEKKLSAFLERIDNEKRALEKILKAFKQ